jgi:predicted kinase
MPRLTMLCGIPCSGKSTHAKEVLVQEFSDPVILSTDDFITRYATEAGKSYVEVFEEAIGLANAYLESMLSHAVSRNQDIIWDQTNVTREERVSKLARIPSGYEKLCVCLHTDLRTALLRNSQRHNKFVPREVIVRMNEQLVLPSNDEGFDFITHLCQSHEI